MADRHGRRGFGTRGGGALWGAFGTNRAALYGNSRLIVHHEVAKQVTDMWWRRAEKENQNRRRPR